MPYTLSRHAYARRLLADKESEGRTFESYAELPISEMDRTLNGLRNELCDSMHAINHLADSDDEERKAQREKRLSQATKKVAIVEAAVGQQRTRRATLA